MHEVEPVLHPVRIADLRPTQMTVGYREVERKRRQWRERVERDGPEFLGRNMIPAVKGPGDQLWIIDHHHEARALHEEGVDAVLVQLVTNLSHLSNALFKGFMDNRGWFHPFDAKGKRQAIKDLPRHIGGLEDDPYRSLAGELRRAGGFAKDTTPFAEFMWADYLRGRIRTRVVEQDFNKALGKALKLANGTEAAYLPGWAGVQG